MTERWLCWTRNPFSTPESHADSDISSKSKVHQICGGFGIHTSVSDYLNANPVHTEDQGYWNSAPGLGSVIRAAVSIARYERTFGVYFSTSNATMETAAMMAPRRDGGSK